MKIKQKSKQWAESRGAVLEEREACAKACEETRIVKGGEVFAAKIRARGNT